MAWTILLLTSLPAGGTCHAAEALSLWPAPPPDRFAIHIDPQQAPPASTWDSLAPQLQPAETPLRLREAAEALGPLPSPAEQFGADVLYCPDYRPQLYPEKTLGQMCSRSLLSSPLLAQGDDGRNPFQVAFSEVRRMQDGNGKLAVKALLAAAHYALHRDSPDALSSAAATMLAEESTGIADVLLDVAPPPIVALLPREMSGLPPFPELGAAYDIRTASRASYNSVADTETMLRTAARRGLDGIAITDLDHIDGVRTVQQAADRLKARGELPEEFQVIPGEEVHTLSGPVIGLFVTDRVQRGMTIKATVDEIHRQGGVAIIADPGTGSGPKLARTLDVDGYLLRSHPASLLRTLKLLDDSDVAAKPLLSGSGSRAEGTVGVPYTVAETQNRSAEGVQDAFREHSTYGATSIQMPLMTAMLFRPFAIYETAMVSYFQARDRLEEVVGGLIGSDNVEIRTSYDKEMARLLGVLRAPSVIGHLFDGSSALTRTPKMLRVSADYGLVRLEYTWEDHTVRLLGAVTW
jgi:hypothetical protein